MNFTRSELRSLTFRRKSRGYNQKDVHDFMKRVEEDYLQYQQIEEELEESKEKISALEEACADYTQVVMLLKKRKEVLEQENIRLSYLETQVENLQKMTERSEQMSQSIEQEADALIEEAQKKATALISHAHKEVEVIVRQALNELEAVKLEQLTIEHELLKKRTEELE